MKMPTPTPLHDGQRSTAQVLNQGFNDPVLDSQCVFRALMSVMAEPGTLGLVSTAAVCPGFSNAMTAVALTLADFEAAIWSDAMDIAAPYLRFHTGAAIVDKPGEASFAFITRASKLTSLDQFRQGTLDYPDQSCTLVVEVSELAMTDGWLLRGPGIKGERSLCAAPLGNDFVSAFQAQRCRFPLGVDVIFCAGDRISALPRSTTLTRTGER